MKKTIVMTIALLCAVAQGAWAQTTTVSTAQDLEDAIVDGANIQLTDNILLSRYLNIEGISVTIDLNGKRLYRNLSSSSDEGHIAWVHANRNNVSGHLTIEDNSTAKSGTIEGGYAPNGGGINVWPGCSLTVNGGTFKNNRASNMGGAIFVRENATATISNASFISNSAGDHGGAIWNSGTVTATSCSFENNSAKDVGALYNAVQTGDNGTYAGTATLTGCTLKSNSSTAGAGALANAEGSTVMNIENCTIQNNTAGSRGGGIWNGGTLNVKGKVIVTGNKKVGDIASNVFLKSRKVITVTGALTTLTDDDLIEESHIGVDMENTSGGTFTSDYKKYHEQIDPKTFFSADLSVIASLGFDNNNEACLTVTNAVYFVVRSWDETDKKVFSTMEKLTGSMKDYDKKPDEGDYKEVTNAPADHPDEWFGMGGYNDNVAEYYVVHGNVSRKTIVVQGSNVHLILCDGATLTLTGGLKLEGTNKLYIHSQSYGGDMGKLIVTNDYDSAAGIGSAWDRVNGELIEKKAGELVIYGGHIEATGGEHGAGIGSCQRRPHQHDDICNRVTVYGGYVEATGGADAAGIGGGAGYELAAVDAGTFTLYDGTVVAQGGNGAAGVGGGGGYASSGSYQGGWGGTVNIYGGELTATGGENGAGIGSGEAPYVLPRYPATRVNIYNGKVTVNGGKNGAGIGCGIGNALHRGVEVYVHNGTVIANGGEGGAGIGGGMGASGGIFKVWDGTVIANGGTGAAGIGEGYKSGNTGYGDDDLVIVGGTVIAKAGGEGGDPNRAFGPGRESAATHNGPLKLGDNMMVGAGNNGTVQKYFPANERKKACWYYSYAVVSPCTHNGSTYTMTEDTHTRQCNYCTATRAEEHNLVDGKCTVCNYETDKTLYAEFYVPDLEGGNKPYNQEPETYYLAPGSTFSLPVCEVIPPGYEFEGWVAGVRDQTTYLTRSNETLLAPLSEYTLTTNETFTARYRELDVNLYNNQFNGETLYTYNGRTAASVKLFDRGIIKDGYWNTLCLPFSLTETQLANSQLAGGDFRTLSSASFSNGTLTLNFTDKGAVTSITAGTPYLVKWANGDDITDLTFSGVKIDYTYHPVETDVVTFSGNFNPVGCSAGDNTMLYLGADNKLYYPSEAMTINSFRAYFQLNNGLTAGEPSSSGGIRAFVLNFGDESEQTGITDQPILNSQFSNLNSEWYTLDGRRLSGKPTTKGLYIVNGRKVVVK